MFFQFSPARAKNKPKVVEKEKESDKVEILSLAPFTQNPKLFFENVKIGEAFTQKLLINNPTNQDVNILLIHSIPDELNVTLNWTEATIKKNANVFLEVTWCPVKEESARHVITVTDGKRIQRDVPVAFKSVSPKKSKTGTKPKAKPKTVVWRQKSPVKKASPVRKSSPTKRYYSTRPPNISPKKYSLSQKKCSPNFKKGSPSPSKRPLIVVDAGSPSPKIQRRTLPLYTDSPKARTTYRSTVRQTKQAIKENIPLPLLNTSTDSNAFVSPSSATFHLDCLQSVERRETYTVNGKEQSPTDSIFNDSLEKNSPDVSPLITRNKERQNANVDHFMKIYDGNKLPLGVSNRENISQNIYGYGQHKPFEKPADYDFEYKLTQLESFCFTPVSTPAKHTENISPMNLSSIERSFPLRKTAETTSAMQLFPEKNSTFEIPQKSPNVSTETYVKSNISTGTYVKGNASFETYVKGNISSGTYTKDSSIGDVASLSLSPVCISPGTSNASQSSATRSYSLSGDNAKNTIEANLWCGIKSRPLSSIQEESYIQQSITEVSDITHKSFLKRKSIFDIGPTSPKRQNVASAPKDWSKKGGAALRVARKTTGLNLQQLVANNKTAEGDKQLTAVLTKKDTNTVIIQNPFLLAATNLADPFMTTHLYIDEEWMDQQQRDFKKWVNALLTPPEQLNFQEQVVDVAKVWQECKKKEVEVAPTKETVSNKYHTNNKLNSLRKSAQTLFRSKQMSEVLSKVVLAVETGKLAIRNDKDVHLNLMLRSEIMSMVLSYNPLWLRIGLETIYNEIIPLKSNSDVMGLSTFVGTRLLKDPYLLKKHKTVHSPKYFDEFKKFFLKKFFVLVYFLDQAKNKKLILHDPCLFCKKAVVKESKEMLLKLAKEMLAAVGDITKYLRHLNYVVTHTQTYIHEFDYAVNNLGVDLRDGVRLTKIMETILLQNDLMSNLRVPAISRLQKIHNMKIVFDSLEKAGYQILYDITPKDIVDGHKEKTLSFLWQIIYKFQAPLMVKSATTIQTWFRSLPIVLKRRKLEREILKRERAASKIQAWYRRQKFAKQLFGFSLLLKTYLETIKRERAVIKIQSYYRMHRCRSRYMLQYMTILGIQRFARGWLVRNIYKLRIKKAVLIQRNVRGYLARKRYLMLKKATNVIQTKYRAKRVMKREHTAYVELKTTVIFVQRRFRANHLAIKEKNTYQELRSAAVCLQQRFRANKLCKQQRVRYLEVRSATVRIQTWYKSVVAMRTCRRQYMTLKTSVIVIQQRYIAIKAMQIERNNYHALRQSCVTIQRQYRAHREMKIKREEYLALKASTIILQRRYRAKKMMEKQKQYYEALRSVSLFIQRKFRANRTMKLVRSNYITVRRAAVTIQIWFKATIEMRRCLTYYASLKYAVHVFEDRYKAKKLMEKQISCYQRLKSASITIQRQYKALLAMRQCKTEYLRLKSAAVFVQSKFRANKLASIQRREYLELKRASVSLQNRYRSQKTMQKARREFLELRWATITVQRRFRANVLMEEARKDYQNLLRCTLNVQQRFRANRTMLVERHSYKTLKNAATLIQQQWRAKKSGEIQQQEFKRLKYAALIIQRRWRANKVARQERITYENLKKATQLVQAKWRAKKLCDKERRAYIKLKNAVAVVQKGWRAKKLGEYERKKYEALRTAAISIQRRWRANKMTSIETAKYKTLKKAVMVVQSRWRARKLAAKERKNYLQLKNSAVLVQQRWRAKKLGKEQKNRYRALRQGTMYVQERWRANKIAALQRTVYQSLKNAAVTIQRGWRAKKLREKERNCYVQLKQTAVAIQRKWRAKKLGQKQLERYKELKEAVVYTQACWRANKKARLERTKYEQLKRAAAVVQNRWRAKKLATKERQSYLQLKNAAVIVQRRWRAKKLGKIQSERYNVLRKATIFIQRKWRANKLAKQESCKYHTMKRSVVIIQSLWRARKAKQNYLQLREATVILQQRWRAQMHCNQQWENYKLLKKTTVIIQRKWRAIRLARQEREKYEALKKATTVIQTKWRARKLAAKERSCYLQLRKAALIVQQRWRANKLCELHKQRYELLKKVTLYIQRRWRLKKLGERDRKNYNALRTAAICIQRRWRARQLMIVTVQRYTLLKLSSIIIQKRYRANLLMKRHRCHYVQIKTSTVIIQRYFRGYLRMKQEKKEFEVKRKAIADLQTYARGYLVRRKYADYFTPEAREKRRIEKMEREAATKIQACWRGHSSRSSVDTAQMMKIRERAKKANLRAEPQNTLGSRCQVALQTLVNEKSTVFIINKALEDLDFITRHCKDICIHVAHFLPEQMYLMIKTTNRSLPEMNACIFSVNILINCYKYAPTRPYSFMSDYIDNIITVMLHWCDKDAQLFPSMCTLLWLFAHNPRWKRFIKSLPNIKQKFSKMQAQVLRKNNMVKRTGAKGHSVFGCCKNSPLPGCEPDWGLEYKQHPHVFTNSVHAFSSLLSVLDM